MKSKENPRFKLFGSGKPWEKDKSVRFAQGVVISAGPLIVLSGQVSVDEMGRDVAPGDLKAQARQAFSTIRDLLAVQGASLDQVVKLTYFVTDMSRWSEVQAARAEFFPTHMPASTTVQVTRLNHPESMIEIEAIAAPAS